jgi:hypothetical protein
MLGGVQPGSQVLGGVEVVDDPVLAALVAGGAEHLGAQVAREAAGRRDDASRNCS